MQWYAVMVNNQDGNSKSYLKVFSYRSAWEKFYLLLITIIIIMKEIAHCLHDAILLWRDVISGLHYSVFYCRDWSVNVGGASI